MGDPTSPLIWNDLDDYLLQRFERSDGRPSIGIAAAAIDTGGGHTAQAYQFVSPRFRRRIWGVKGRAGAGVPAWPLRASRGKGGAPVFVIGVDTLKSTVAARLKVLESGPGHVHFAEHLDSEFFKQLTAEKLVTRFVKGRPVREWRLTRPGARNEALDCHCYAYAALQGLSHAGVSLSGVGPKSRAGGSRVIPSKWLNNQ